MSDQRKQAAMQKKRDKERKEQENKPSFQYMNNGNLEFPKRLKDEILGEYGLVDDKLESIWLELNIIEEQRQIQKDIASQLKAGKIEMKTPDGGRLAYESELLTMNRIADATIWQSKQKLEKVIREMISYVGVSVPMSKDKFLLTEQEHNDMAMDVIARAEKSGVKLFAPNKAELLQRIKSE